MAGRRDLVRRARLEPRSSSPRQLGRSPGSRRTASASGTNHASPAGSIPARSTRRRRSVSSDAATRRGRGGSRRASVDHRVRRRRSGWKWALRRLPAGWSTRSNRSAWNNGWSITSRWAAENVPRGGSSPSRRTSARAPRSGGSAGSFHGPTRTATLEHERVAPNALPRHRRYDTASSRRARHEVECHDRAFRDDHTPVQSRRGEPELFEQVGEWSDQRREGISPQLAKKTRSSRWRGGARPGFGSPGSSHCARRLRPRRGCSRSGRDRTPWRRGRSAAASARRWPPVGECLRRT